MTKLLSGKKGLITGIANNNSIAWGCAQAFYEAGAALAITYQNEKAEPHVRPLSEAVRADLILPLDVRDDSQLDQVFSCIAQKWGKLDFVLHAVAYAPKQDLQGRVVDCSRPGFLAAMDISCYSFIRMAHLAEPLMTEGGCLLTLTYYGGEKVIHDYGIMGPVKSALEASVMYLAHDLGSAKIRVNALSPGPIMTRAASGIAHFDNLLKETLLRSPEPELVTIQDIGDTAVFLVSDPARHITGNILFIDSGYHITGD